VITVREAVTADFESMIDVFEGTGFGAHARLCWHASEGWGRLGRGWFVAVIGGNIVGAAQVNLAVDYGDLLARHGFGPPHAMVSAIAVLSDHRRKGVGSALLQAIGLAGAGAGSRFLVLVPLASDGEGNDPVAFYCRHGLTALEEERADGTARYGAPIVDLADASRFALKGQRS
jgi:GNAT superfamily N-acetyltransferase